MVIMKKKIEVGDVVQQKLIYDQPFKKYSGAIMIVLEVLPEGIKTRYSLLENILYPHEIFLTIDDIKELSAELKADVEAWKNITEESKLELWNEWRK